MPCGDLENLPERYATDATGAPYASPALSAIRGPHYDDDDYGDDYDNDYEDDDDA